MKPNDMAKRIEVLFRKLTDNEAQQHCRLLRFDPNSMPESEQRLFRNNSELYEEYQKTGDVTIILRNFRLFAKQAMVMLNQITDLYAHIVIRQTCCIFDNIPSELIEYFFNLYFKNFQADLGDCIVKLQTWTKEEQQEYLESLEKGGKIIFRIPRGSSLYDAPKRLSKPKRSDS